MKTKTNEIHDQDKVYIIIKLTPKEIICQKFITFMFGNKIYPKSQNTAVGAATALVEKYQSHRQTKDISTRK